MADLDAGAIGAGTVFVALLGGAVALLVRKSRRDAQAARERAEREAATYRARESAVADLLARIDASGGRNLSFGDLGEHIQAPAGEHVYWAGVVRLLAIDHKTPGGTGLLLVTDKHVIFRPHDARGTVWSKTWKTLLGWDAMPGNQLRVDIANARPRVFQLPPTDALSAHYDVRVAKRLMDLARAAPATRHAAT